MLVTWKRGRQLVLDKIRSLAMPVDVFFRDFCENFPQVSGTAIYMFNLNEGIPTSLMLNLRHNKVLHERMVIVTVRVFDVPWVPEIDRVEVKDLGESFWQITVQYGFKDDPDLPTALALCAPLGLAFSMMANNYMPPTSTVNDAQDTACVVMITARPE